jgi:hypothetical protein
MSSQGKEFQHSLRQQVLTFFFFYYLFWAKEAFVFFLAVVCNLIRSQ